MPSDGLVLLAVLTLPFTQALTLDVGFPLKISEVAILGALPLRLLTGRHVGSIPRRLLAWSGALVVGTAVSLSWALLGRSNRPPDFGLYRFGAAIDGVLQLGYLILAVAMMLLVTDLSRRRRGAVVRIWLTGAVMAVAYAAYVNLNAALSTSLATFPGTSQQTISVGSLTVFRAGTFLEGNYFGMYLLISTIIALTSGRLTIAVLTTAGLLISVSTPNIALALCVWMFFLLRVWHGRVPPQVPLLILPVILLATWLPAAYYESAFLQKATAPMQSQSVIERTASAGAAISMFRDQPVAGVGIAQYGLYFGSHRPAFLPFEYMASHKRYIPNNVYAQVAGETGVLGLVPFVVLLSVILRQSWRGNPRLWSIGLIAVLISLNAFPSFTVTFLWAFYGLVVGRCEPSGDDAHHANYSSA